ncbi:MAG: hypothetical protein V4553_19865 [Bacteroidota bacterium]
MKSTDNRREFIRKVAISGVGLGLTAKIADAKASIPAINDPIINIPEAKPAPDVPWVPRRAASWWGSIEDLQWPQKGVTDKIKRRAEGFAKANIDTAINFGFHMRFDFANYFGQLHGYFATVCEELHKHGIKFMDHYSCNHTVRPRGMDELKKLQAIQRHCVLLFNDENSARQAQYEGYKFDDICQVDIRTGARGYSPIYQVEPFCHNNPKFLDMHAKYLQRSMREAPIDGFEVDDMCNYAGLNVCNCKYCQDRFKKDYGQVVPPHTDKTFWGNITGDFAGGNYENPAFRDWLRMRSDIITEHVKMVKGIIGNKPLMTCVSSSGPMRLNALTLNLEHMASTLDFFMLENVGFNVKSVNWTVMDAEALHQKDIAQKRGSAPAMALSYTIYEKGAYLGWALSRFWGVGNWCSTLYGRLTSDPADRMDDYEVVDKWNTWEIKHSAMDFREGKDLVEVRLVNNNFCKDNGWRDADGKEQWDKVKAWSAALLKNNVGYRFVRSTELADANELNKEHTPLILDSIACVSDKQFNAISNYLAKGGIAWLALPFGTHDDKGFKRTSPLSEKLLASHYKNLVIVETATKADTLDKLITEKRFKPILKQVAGGSGWVARVRHYGNKPVIHFMNTTITAIPHPVLKDGQGNAVLKDMESKITDNNLRFEIDAKRLSLGNLTVRSPELEAQERRATVQQKNSLTTLSVNLSNINVYAVIG